MSTPNNGSPFYSLELSSFIRSEIRSLAKQAALMGQKQKYFDAWRVIDGRLRREPRRFGECHYHMAKGQFRCHIGIVEPVAVEFAIHEAKHKVVLLRVTLLGT